MRLRDDRSPSLLRKIHTYTLTAENRKRKISWVHFSGSLWPSKIPQWEKVPIWRPPKFKSLFTRSSRGNTELYRYHMPLISHTYIWLLAKWRESNPYGQWAQFFVFPTSSSIWTSLHSLVLHTVFPLEMFLIQGLDFFFWLKNELFFHFLLFFWFFIHLQKTISLFFRFTEV